MASLYLKQSSPLCPGPKRAPVVKSFT